MKRLDKNSTYLVSKTESFNNQKILRSDFEKLSHTITFTSQNLHSTST